MKHLIKIDSTPHGVLGVRHAGFDQQYCEAGEQVILKWQPDAKWGLQEAHYTDGDGNVTTIDLTRVKVDGVNVVAFVMPNKDITIGGTFKMFVSQDWTEGTNPSKGEVLTVGNNGEPTPISVDELANEIAEGDNNLVDSIDAINPFKGWYANLATLQASHPSPQVGDYAYVKGAESTDPAAIYECTTAGIWSDSGRTADTSNVQTFASGEEVNEVHIVDNLESDVDTDVLSAKQGKVIGDMLNDTTEVVETPITLTANKYYNFYGENVGDTFSSPSSALTGTYCKKINNLVTGDIYDYIGVADTAAIKIAITNSSNVITRFLTPNSHSETLRIVVAEGENGGHIYFNFYQYDSTTDGLWKVTTQQNDGLVTRVTNIEGNFSNYEQLPLKGKKIVFFGDSLSEFVGSVGNVPTNFANISSASVYAAAIGGTQVVPRGSMVQNPSSQNEAYSNLEITNLISAWAGGDLSYQQAAVDYLNGIGYTYDYQPQLDALVNCPIADADIVVIGCGTNDFTQGSPIGAESDSTSASVCGAINSIVQTLITAKPKLKVYFWTPVVGKHLSGGNYVWDDVYKNQNNMTKPQFIEALSGVVRHNHVSVIDMYWSLGWNEYNIDAYFKYYGVNDYTHPYNGFDVIARRLYRQIISLME